MGVMKRLSGIVQAKTNKLLDKAEDPRESLDLSYQKQLESLQKVRRSVADVTTAKKRIELQAGQLQQQADKLQQQAKAALDAGQRRPRPRGPGSPYRLAEQLTDLSGQHEQVAGQEEKLVATAQKLQSQVDSFRTKKETMKATYTAAEAQTKIGEAVSGISESMSDAGHVDAAGPGQDRRHAGQGRGDRRAPGLGGPDRPDPAGGRHPGPTGQGVDHLHGRCRAGRVEGRGGRGAPAAELPSAAPPGTQPVADTAGPAGGTDGSPS